MEVGRDLMGRRGFDGSRGKEDLMEGGSGFDGRRGSMKEWDLIGV